MQDYASFRRTALAPDGWELPAANDLHPPYLTNLFHVMAALGRIGFTVTLGRYGGDFVWRLLRESYLRKFPDRTGPRRRTTAQAREKDRLRAQARRLYPESHPCVVCGATGTQRDHVRGVLAGNGPENVGWRCDRCHGKKTQAERQACWGIKGHTRKRRIQP